MLLPMLFCITFFVLPLIGMVVCALRKNERRKAEGQTYFRDASARDKQAAKAKGIVFPVLADKRIIQYQLIESQVHEPLHFKKIKDKAPCRAGP